jgi:nucleotide-binding universal stress UspA family protein
MAVHSPIPLPTNRVVSAPDDDARRVFAVDRSLGDQLRAGSLLVAVTGGPDTTAPVTVAAALEHRYAARVSALQVMDISDAPLPAPLPSVFTLARDLIGDAPYEADVRARRQQFAAILGAPNQWPVRIALGMPASEILRAAETHGSSLIVMGLRQHGLVDRALHDETTLTVARRARATVFGVVGELCGLPRTAVVGVDFGPASIRAARAALDVLARPVTGAAAALRLVYVNPDVGDGAREAAAGERLVRRLGVAAGFEQLVRELNAPPEVTVDWTVLGGSASEALLTFATETNADLIAVGSLRHERVERWILGSVTTAIIRDGRCSVLVIPPRR